MGTEKLEGFDVAYPERIPKEDMEACMNEWKLAGKVILDLDYMNLGRVIFVGSPLRGGIMYPRSICSEFRYRLIDGEWVGNLSIQVLA